MKALLRAFCAVVLTGIPALIAPAAEAPAQAVDAVPPLGVFVAVVRADGLMIPLAAAPRNSLSWIALGAHDPASGDLETIRIRHRAAIPAEGWVLHRRDGSRRMPLTIDGMETIAARCERQEVLKTSILPVGTTDYERGAAGIATHGKLDMLRVEDVVRQPDDASSEVGRLVTQITQAFEAQLASQRLSGLADVPAERRANTEVQIMKLYRVRDDYDISSYYFQAQKSYGRTRTYARGWVRSARSRLSLTEVSAGVDRGGESASIDSVVLGAIRYGADQLWVMENFGYEGSNYTMVGMGGIQVGVSAGGC